MVNQLLFGETMDVLDENEKWWMVRMTHDQYEGWIDKKQVIEYNGNEDNKTVTGNAIQAICEDSSLKLIAPGSILRNYNQKHFECGIENFQFSQAPQRFTWNEVETVSRNFLHSPYLWGGRTHYGLDCSGFTQMVFRICGKWIMRDSVQQALQGDAINFIEETQMGDLAFFDNAEGKITHVGIVLVNQEDGTRKVIHSSGKVRLDQLDSFGIYNAGLGDYSHKLRILRRI